MVNAVNGLRIILDFNHVTINNYIGTFECLENHREELFGEVPQSAKRIAIFDVCSKEKQHEANAFKEPIVVCAKLLLAFVNRNEKQVVVFFAKGNCFSH